MRSGDGLTGGSGAARGAVAAGDDRGGVGQEALGPTGGLRADLDFRSARVDRVIGSAARVDRASDAVLDVRARVLFTVTCRQTKSPLDVPVTVARVRVERERQSGVVEVEEFWRAF
jgi:hypothetical protein